VKPLLQPRTIARVKVLSGNGLEALRKVSQDALLLVISVRDWFDLTFILQGRSGFQAASDPDFDSCFHFASIPVFGACFRLLPSKTSI
jgi:hypothetical protein